MASSEAGTAVEREVAGAGVPRAPERTVAGMQPTGREWTVPVVCVLVGIGVLGASHAAALRDLGVFWWNNQAYGHGLLVAPIAAWLVWSVRGTLATLSPVPSMLGLPVLVVLVLGAVAGNLGGILVLEQLCVLMAIPAIALCAFGWNVMRVLGFPLLYPILAVPVWDVLSVPLQDLTADAATWLLPRMGIPVFREGNLLSTPYGGFSIEEVCSGVRFFLAALCISTLYAWMNLYLWVHRIVFVAVCLSISVVFNWIRVVVIIVIGHTSRMQSPYVEDHLTLGWLLFAVGLVPMLWLGHRLTRREERAYIDSPHVAPGTRRGHVAVAALAALITLASPVLLTRGGVMAVTPVDDWALAVPAGWSETNADGELTGWWPSYGGATAETGRALRRGGVQVHVYAAYFAPAETRGELVNQTNKVFDPERWLVVGAGGRTVDVAGGRSISVNELLLSRGGRGLTVWYWYQIGDVVTGSRIWAKALHVRDLLTTRRGGFVTVLATPRLGDDRKGAEQRLADLCRDVCASIAPPVAPGMGS